MPPAAERVRGPALQELFNRAPAQGRQTIMDFSPFCLPVDILALSWYSSWEEIRAGLAKISLKKVEFSAFSR